MGPWPTLQDGWEERVPRVPGGGGLPPPPDLLLHAGLNLKYENNALPSPGPAAAGPGSPLPR